MSKIVVLQGPPASGKSTFAKQFIKDNHNYVIVSRDSIRDSLGEYWVPSRENLVNKIERNNIINAIEMGFDVIIDATNLNPKTIAKWEALADEKQCEIEYKQFWIPYHEAIKRDNNDDRAHKVGVAVIRSFYSKYNPDLLNEENWDNRYIKEQDITKPKVVLCDIDGTIAIHQGRSPYDYEKCDTDKPNAPLVATLSDLFRAGSKIIFVSGREDTGSCRQKTTDWLNKNFGFPFELMMRKEKDRRSDAITKEEIYHNEIEPNYNVICVFEDRDKVVKMWRDQGLLCNQVYYGDF